MTASEDVQLITHIGICVSDLERSLAFYTNVLGFQEVGRFSDKGGFTARTLDLPDVELEAVYLDRDGWRIELLHYPAPGHVGNGQPRVMNALGLTHLSFRVSDFDAVTRRLLEYGGKLLERTFIEPRGGKVSFGTDPDGMLIEIIQIEGDPRAVPGQ